MPETTPENEAAESSIKEEKNNEDKRKLSFTTYSKLSDARKTISSGAGKKISGAGKSISGAGKSFIRNVFQSLEEQDQQLIACIDEFIDGHGDINDLDQAFREDDQEDNASTIESTRIPSLLPDDISDETIPNRVGNFSVKLPGRKLKFVRFIELLDGEFKIFKDETRSKLLFSMMLAGSVVKSSKDCTFSICAQHIGKLECVFKIESEARSWETSISYWQDKPEKPNNFYIEAKIRELVDDYIQHFEGNTLPSTWATHIAYIKPKIEALLKFILKKCRLPFSEEHEAAIDQLLKDYRQLAPKLLNTKENALKVLLRLCQVLINRCIPIDRIPSDSNILKRIPKLSICILAVGSRGDVQPFVAVAKKLVEDGHRVRIATHEVFRNFVTSNKIEFFQLAGDPRELMDLMSDSDVFSSKFLKEIMVNKRAWVKDLLLSCYLACTKSWDSIGNMPLHLPDGSTHQRNYKCDLIIANPVSFAGPHIAEALGIPIHMAFTMPWTPTHEFSSPFLTWGNDHPANVHYRTYGAVDKSIWLWSRDIVNHWRETVLKLPPALKASSGSRILRSRRVPFIYCFSSHLLPKPRDWGHWIDVVGFWFLDTKTNYTPDPELEEFINAGEPPVFIGFGSIVVQDAADFSQKIIKACIQTKRRCLIQSGWTEFSSQESIPDHIKIIGAAPHDWLFPRCSVVVHHGGAGTVSTGLLFGKPTVVVPFFGDQFFWGKTIARAGAGPEPSPYTSLTSEKLATAIECCFDAEVMSRASQIGERIRGETGTDTALNRLKINLPLDAMIDDLFPSEVARVTCEDCQLQLSYKSDKVLHYDESRPEMFNHKRFQIVHIDWTAHNPLRKARGFHGEPLTTEDFFSIHDAEVDDEYRETILEAYDRHIKDENKIQITPFKQEHPANDVYIKI